MWPHPLCRNPNIGFTIKWSARAYEAKRVCLGVKHILTNGESARDGALQLPSALPLWELHLCKSCECS